MVARMDVRFVGLLDGLLDVDGRMEGYMLAGRVEKIDEWMPG